MMWGEKPRLRETSPSERMDGAKAGVQEISTVSRSDRQTVEERRRHDCRVV